jgi:hypothetical protein
MIASSAVRARLALLLLAAACARHEMLIVSAAPAEGGVRVRFRRPGATEPDRPPELLADGGQLEELVCSPDLLGASALWRAPAGALRCRFPYGGTAAFDAGGPVDPAEIRYVFLEEDGARVTADLPRGCLLLPRLLLRVRLRADHLPARLVLPGGAAVPLAEETVAELSLPRDRRGVLRRGDAALALVTARGELGFLIGIDADGTPAALSGYVDAGPKLGASPGTP